MSSQLYDAFGRRLYCTADERKAFLKEAEKKPTDIALFSQLLTYSGCRISEALALTPAQIDKENGVVIFETLKKRKRGIFRAVPLPDFLLNQLLQYSKSIAPNQRIWPWCRTKAWKEIKAIMISSDIEGVHASSKGLRHGFAVSALEANAPLNMVSKWLGHSSLETTAIYANACGNEERKIAQKIWD